MSKIPYTFVPIPYYFFKNGWFSDAKYISYIVWAFSRCSTVKRTVQHDHKEVELEPFEFITGRRTCSDDTGLTEREIRTIQSNLEAAGILIKTTSKTTNKFTVYKWVVTAFSLEGQQNDQQNDQQKTNPQYNQNYNSEIERPAKRPAKRPASDHNQEEKEDKNFKKTTTKESDKEKIVRFGSPSFDDDRLEGYCLYAEHHELRIQESDFKKWLKHPDDRINSNLIRLIDKKDKVKNHAAWMQAAIDRDYAGIEKLIEKNLKFTEDFKKKNKWHNLTITKQYCRNEKTGNDFQYHLPEFRQMLENEYKKEKKNYG